MENGSINEPVLLSNGRDVDTAYLEEALKERNIPYDVEEGEHTPPSSYIQEGIAQVVTFTNYYVDKKSWKLAKEALLSAREETKKAGKHPVGLTDGPGGKAKPADWLREDEEDGQDDNGSKHKHTGNPWSWFIGLDTTARLVVVAVAVVFLVGLYAVLFT